jgi:hypothetical protein
MRCEVPRHAICRHNWGLPFCPFFEFPRMARRNRIGQNWGLGDILVPSDLSLSPCGLAGYRTPSRCPLPKSDKSAVIADTLGTGFRIRAIAQRPERAIATGSPEGGGRLALLWPRQHWGRHHDLPLLGRKHRPTGRFHETAAPAGASIFRGW